jgi:DNA-binding SARP family transcriptional activator
MLSIGLLGALTIRVNDRRIKADFGSAGRLLVAYLAHYSGRPHRRERLADLFWGGLEPNRGRSALNTALWRLRKAIAAEPQSAGGRNLVTLGNEIVLEPADWFAIDTQRFMPRRRTLCATGAAKLVALGKLADGCAAAIFRTLPRGRG